MFALGTHPRATFSITREWVTAGHLEMDFFSRRLQTPIISSYFVNDSDLYFLTYYLKEIKHNQRSLKYVEKSQTSDQIHFH